MMNFKEFLQDFMKDENPNSREEYDTLKVMAREIYETLTEQGAGSFIR